MAAMELDVQSRESNGRVVPDTHARPTVADLNGENHYAQTARKHWLRSSKPPKVHPQVVKTELWDMLEKDGFPYSSLLILETLQLLEKYLWPGYTDDASNHHVLLLALLVNVKRRENLPLWDHFATRPSEFSSFFRRILSMSIDPSLPHRIRTHIVVFVIGAFQSLDSGLVRKECAPLVSIAIWQNFHSESARAGKLERNVMLRKAWKSAAKKYDGGDDEAKTKLRFERAWLYTLLLDFLNRIYDPVQVRNADNLLYCERFVELLVDLESQLPTRRYVNTLLHDLNLLPAMRLSPLYTDEENGLFRDLCTLLRHFIYFPIDDHNGQQQTPALCHEAYAKLARLQRIAIKHFPSKLTILALSNYASLDRREDLEAHLETLTEDELIQLCEHLGLRTKYPTSSLVVPGRSFYIEIIASAHERRPTLQESVREMSVFPTEHTLYEPTFLRNEAYDGSRSLAIPKLKLQYLSIGDFLWRSFILHRCEAFYEIRKDMEDVIKRLQRKNVRGTAQFSRGARTALPISKPAIIDVAPAKVGHTCPFKVQAEVILDVGQLSLGVLKEWESLRQDDVVYLLSINPPHDSRAMGNGGPPPSDAERIGLRHLRCAEVMQVLDENGRLLRERRGDEERQYRRVHQRRLIIKLDSMAYHEDIGRVAEGHANVYESINLIVRRRGQENNFKPILESIRRLTLSDFPTASWLQEVFLGYGDPAGATYKRLANRLRKIDFRDTFLNWDHLISSFPESAIEPVENTQGGFGPPYVLELPEEQPPDLPSRHSTKRRRTKAEQSELAQGAPAAIRVSTYKPPNMGPYPTDAPKLNTVPFTPAQVEAIMSGTQPGLTVIVGPPGTGKTDVATQIINNIYHNFPSQRTLLIAHSNQALNQLFQKIVALDIDERHLLRLGHGEGELETEASYSKHGRVESFREIGTRYLAEVERLAASIGAPGAHGQSCETAGYFNSVYVVPAWTNYWNAVESGELSGEDMVAAFPFHQYFSNAPQPLFPCDVSRESLVDIAAGCYRHIEKIFSELEDIGPFELLWNPKDSANYLLIKEARIIAMTSTHAAIRRQEIAHLGFHYDNVIVEEAAQITEIGNFIPMALQNPTKGELPLQRVVLCGDHLQNSPVVQNLAFRQYADLEQSLFLRLVRLGVPTIMLDQQGRARPSLAALYRWRYPKLGDLPVVKSGPEFQAANAGFRFEYQFINVPDYKGRGERQPTPHFMQNLGEAEYAVALYMYMRLLGYPASKVSILTTYAGQRALIRDVLSHRCAGNRLFGMPRIVTTVDKYQGEQNDYVILSLVRTARVGYLRDVRRLTVALSRARLGLYVLGRRDVFEASYELKPAMDLLLQRPDRLALVINEMYPTTRPLEDTEPGPTMTEMEGVEHLGQYVFEMTQAKVAALNANGGVLPPVEPMPLDEEDMDVDDDAGDEGVMEKAEEEEDDV